MDDNKNKGGAGEQTDANAAKGNPPQNGNAGDGEGANAGDDAGKKPKDKNKGGAGEQTDANAGSSLPKVDRDTRTALLKRARLAGATKNSLDELEAELDKAPASSVGMFREQIAKLRRKNRKPYHVVSEGSVRLDGELYESGESLLLTEQEAADLGDGVVLPGNAPPKAAEISTRKAGKYRVVEPRNVMHAGKIHGPGTELELSAEDARSIGDYVEEA